MAPPPSSDQPQRETAGQSRPETVPAEVSVPYSVTDTRPDVTVTPSDTDTRHITTDIRPRPITIDTDTDTDPADVSLPHSDTDTRSRRCERHTLRH